MKKVSVQFAAASARVPSAGLRTVARLDLTGVTSIKVVGLVRKGSSAREQALLPKARAAAIVGLLRARGFTGIIATAERVGTTGTAQDRRVDIELTRK